MKPAEEWSFDFSVLIKKQDDLWLAHCLELDIVATGSTMEQAECDLDSRMKARVESCFRNDNLDDLFRGAPRESWDEFHGNVEKERPMQNHAEASILRKLVSVFKYCQPKSGA